MFLAVFVIDPAPETVHDSTTPFLIVAVIVAVILVAYWLRRRANS